MTSTNQHFSKTHTLFIMFVLTCTLLQSCKKNQDLGSEFEQTVGTYTSIGDPIKITVDRDKQQVICNLSAERGYKFKISKVYIPPLSAIHIDGQEWPGIALANRDSKGKNLTIYRKPGSDTVLIYVGTKVVDFTGFNDRTRFVKHP